MNTLSRKELAEQRLNKMHLNHGAMLILLDDTNDVFDWMIHDATDVQIIAYLAWKVVFYNLNCAGGVISQ